MIIGVIVILLFSSIGTFDARAEESEYLNVDFQDGSTAPFVPNAGTGFQVQTDGTGNYYLASPTTVGLKSMYASIAPTWTPDSFELSFDFKISDIAIAYFLFSLCNSTSTPKNPGQAALCYATVYVNGSLYIDGVYTPFVVNDGKWHNLFINFTYGCHARISLDGSIPWMGYFSLASEFPHVYYCFIGSGASTTKATCFWDNITMVSRIGSLPIASFDYSPLDGDGLTNFVFTDTSTFDNTIFPISYNWTFGDGNYTLTKNSNHTYIYGGDYMITLNVSNRFGYDLAFANISVSQIDFSGGIELDLSKIAILTFIIFFLAITTIVGLKYWFFMVLSGIGYLFVAVMVVEPLDSTFAILMAGAGVLFMLWGGYRYVS